MQPLRALRKRLEDPATFQAAAAEIQTWARTETTPAAQDPARGDPSPTPDLARLSPDRLLDQMLDEAQQRTPEAGLSRDLTEWNVLVRELVRPYLIPRANPQRAELLTQLDAAAGGQMRAILHDPVFQAIEAAWRGIFFLVRRLETDSQLQLYLVDVSKAELAADLGSTEDLRATGTYRLLVEQSVGMPGGQPWAVLAGNYTFDQSHEDVELLGRLAKIARQAGAPFLAAASPHILGCVSWAETPDPDDWQRPIDPQDRQAWEALRQLPEASYLGLVQPRFLLRVPYGADTDPTERFPFEEMAGPPAHEEYLWGNPAFACVYVLAEAFSQYAWSMRPGMVQEIEGLPLHVYQKDGDSFIQPCAEAWLSERAAERILEMGLIPLLSLRGRDVVRLARFQSLARPATPLGGRWSHGSF
jgi:type VI secretion system protein ImpC